MKKRILFQGDSITDCGRKREEFYGMGSGYPNLVKASLGMKILIRFTILRKVMCERLLKLQ